MSELATWFALSFVASLACLTVGWLVHTRVRGVFPDDLPTTSGRKAHGRPVAMAGILPAVLTVVAALALHHWTLALAVAIAAAVGFVDDLGKSRPEDPDHPPTDPLPWWAKALLLFAAAAVVVLPARGATPSTFIGLVLLVFVVTNAVNFLDNMNGVATFVAGTGLALTAIRHTADSSNALVDEGAWHATVPFAALACGVWLAVLPWNWPNARMFLGDAGAYALGITLAGLAVHPAGQAVAQGSDPIVSGIPSLALLLAPLAVPLADFVQVVTSRLIVGTAPWVGDRRHVSHLLHLHAHVPRTLVGPILAVAAAGAFFAVGFARTAS